MSQGRTLHRSDENICSPKLMSPRIRIRNVEDKPGPHPYAWQKGCRMGEECGCSIG